MASQGAEQNDVNIAGISVAELGKFTGTIAIVLYGPFASR